MSYSVRQEDAALLRKLQLAELDILKEVVKICEREKLNYCLLGGTFLGAVRHKGFIPWDDDIDIGMPRPDYEKFFDIATKELPEQFIYRNFKKGNESTIFFSRVEDSSVMVEDSSAIKTRRRYAWIDIFPLDGMPNNKFLRKVHQFNLLFKRLLVQYSQFSTIVNQDLPNRPWHEALLIKLGNVIDFEKMLDTNKCMINLEKALTKYSYHESEYAVNFYGIYKFKEMFKKTIYEDTVLYEFEDSTFLAPRMFDVVLTQLYGDYMTLPPEQDRNKHHTKVVEVDE